VILTGLPGRSDESLVASLIHGGDLECYRLTQASEGEASSTAAVTFTTGTAARAYYVMYPNGIEVKHNGHRYVVMVELSDQVEPLSGRIGAYIETGASRVVRVLDADDDWTMGALHKIAVGKNRKVEAIVDTLRDSVSARRSSIL
jgi:hypothetical protein